MKNYSQNNEQEVILKYFGNYKGTFADIGANDGVTFSNTRALALSGWKGCFIEASPKAFLKLISNNLGGEFYYNEVALTARAGKMMLQESGPLVGKEDVSLVSTFHAHEMDRFKKAVDYTPVMVECITWPEFMKTSPFKSFDFISMDIEGSELEVLPQMDLSQVKMFCIEWNGNKALKQAYEPYFEGFKLIHTTGENLIYAR